MTTTRASFEKAKRPMAIIAALVLCSLAAGAQPSLPPGTPVRITLASKEFMEGSLVSGDTGSITVRLNANDIAIPRREIATMSARSATRGMRYVGMLGTATGTLGALMFYGLAAGLCDRSSGCGEEAMLAGAIGAGAGFLAGAGAGAIIGALYRDWEPVTESVDVAGRARGPSARETCPSNPAVAVQGGLGWARGGRTGRTGDQPAVLRRTPTVLRVGVTLLCRSAFSVGAEGGSLGGEVLASFSETAQGTTRTNVSITNDRSSAFRGGFVEMPLHGRLNPRLIASVGSYSRAETTSTSTYTIDGTSSQYAFSSADDTARHAGGSLGVGFSMPLFAYASLGADARIHLVAGESSIRTLGFTLNVRR